MAGGSWSPTELPVRPGLYLNFKEAAAAQITGGPRGIVAIPLLSYKEGVTAKAIYSVSNESQAHEAFGSENIRSIRLALQGGAKEVLVYTMPATPATADYADMREALDAELFNVFVFDGEFEADEQAAMKAWVAANRDDGKHFMAVIGGDAAEDADPVDGNSRSTLNSDNYIVNLISGVKTGEDALSSAEFAPYIAGVIAGTSVNRSVTYLPVAADDVTKRLTNAQIRTALQAGSLVLTHDGEKVKIEQGLATSKKKIRAVRARQAVSTDVTKTAADAYIGKIDNNADGQAALISAVKAYLETLENANVLTDIQVQLHPQHVSSGDSVYLLISYTEVDSMERIFLDVHL